jgi:hypothetical protein
MIFLLLSLIAGLIFARPHKHLAHGGRHKELNFRPATRLLQARGVQPQLAAFSLKDVTLSSGSFVYEGQELNTRYLHMLDPDRLLYSYRYGLLSCGILSQT